MSLSFGNFSEHTDLVTSGDITCGGKIDVVENVDVSNNIICGGSITVTGGVTANSGLFLPDAGGIKTVVLRAPGAVPIPYQIRFPDAPGSKNTVMVQTTDPVTVPDVVNLGNKRLEAGRLTNVSFTDLVNCSSPNDGVCQFMQIDNNIQVNGFINLTIGVGAFSFQMGADQWSGALFTDNTFARGGATDKSALMAEINAVAGSNKIQVVNFVNALLGIVVLIINVTIQIP